MEDDDVYDVVPDTSAEKSVGLSSLISRFNKDPVMNAAMAAKPVLKPKPNVPGSVARQPKPQPLLPPKTGPTKGKPPPVLPKNAVKLPNIDFHKDLLHPPGSPKVSSPTVGSRGNEFKPVTPPPSSNGLANDMVSNATAPPVVSNSTAPPVVTREKENKPVPDLPARSSPTAVTKASTEPPLVIRTRERKALPEPPTRTTPEKPALHIKLGRDGLRYQLLPCPMATGPPPKKPARPTNVVLPKMVPGDEYDEGEELYDEVGIDTSTRPASIIPEYTEEEESKEIKQHKERLGIPPPDTPIEEVYDDTDSRPLPPRPPTISGEEIYDDLDNEMPPPLPPPFMPGEEVYDDVDSDMPPPPVPPHLPDRNPPHLPERNLPHLPERNTPVKRKEVEKEEEFEEEYDDIHNTEENGEADGEALYEAFDEVVDTGKWK